jgi:hypothetical protein
MDFEAKIKLDTTEYSILWDVEDKISIPSELTAALSSEEMIRLVVGLRTLKLWMDEPDKKKIVLLRNG